MKTRLIRIGNSQGIRIPDPLVEEAGLEGDLEIRAEGQSLVIRPAKKPRAGWADSFKEMARRGDDALLDDVPGQSDWDAAEWQW
jgi:antitoxin MazE